jgi:hypothetical protein
MNLSGLHTITLSESSHHFDSVPILEDDEGPRWRFKYSNFKNDPQPDILLLGAYRHPNTGNNLIGGINLHYLNRKQIATLAKILPQIMKGKDLYSRYHIGKRYSPDIFTYFYRTYDAKHIHGVAKDVLYPKYGLRKTAADWMKKKYQSIFKSPEERSKAAEPKYPEDIAAMQGELDKVVQQLQQTPPTDPSFDTPEVQAANKAKQAEYTQNKLTDIQKREDTPLIKSLRDTQRQQNPQLKPTTPLDMIGPSINTDASDKMRERQLQKEVPPELQQMKKKDAFEREIRKNEEEIEDSIEPTEILPPENETPPKDTGEEPIITSNQTKNTAESVLRYYSPIHKRYIVEYINYQYT